MKPRLIFVFSCLYFTWCTCTNIASHYSSHATYFPDILVLLISVVSLIRIMQSNEKMLLGNVFCHGENLFIQVETTAPPPRRRTLKKRSFRYNNNDDQLSDCVGFFFKLMWNSIIINCSVCISDKWSLNTSLLKDLNRLRDDLYFFLYKERSIGNSYLFTFHLSCFI